MSWLKSTAHIWVTVGLAMVGDLVQIGGGALLGPPTIWGHLLSGARSSASRVSLH